MIQVTARATTGSRTGYSGAVNSLVGTRLVYTYANGWEYEMYVKNDTTIDYRIHSGMVGGRWVKDQAVTLGSLDDGVHTVSWTEPTGTSVAITFDLPNRRSHGTIFFPRWVADDPKATVCFQNDHLDEMVRRRDAGPTYPVEVVDENSTITLIEHPGPDDESVIATGPSTSR